MNWPRHRPSAPRAVLATLGTLGDIYPFVTIATALMARGIDAVIAAPDTHRAAIESENVPFIRIRPNEDDLGAALKTDVAGAYRIMLDNPHFILDDIYMRFLRETYEDVVDAARGADVLVTHSLLVGAHLAAESLGVPHARVGLAPMHLQSATLPSVTPSTPYVLGPRTPFAVVYNKVVRAAVRASVNLRSRRLRTFRREIGLPPSTEDLFLDFGRRNRADKIFGLYSPCFAPAQKDQPRNLEVVGFPFARPNGASRRQLDPQLQTFLSSGPPPIVFTLGSFAPAVSGSFYDVSIQAARRLGARGVILAGPKDAVRLGDLVGPDVHICPCAPHHLLFPQCLGVVHHGGIGTTAEALRAGKPQVVVPFFGDQPDNAARLERLGVGLALKLADYDVTRACKSLEAMRRGDLGRRAAVMAETLRLDGGVTQIGEWVEAAARRRAPSAASARKIDARALSFRGATGEPGTRCG